jgi:DNA-binding CsgD family transcriptional regulator
MGEASRAQSDYTLARDYYERSAELRDFSPPRLGLAFTGLWLGDMELARVRALHYLGLVNKLRVAERSQWKMEIALAFMLLVGVCGLTHQFADAARLFGVIDQFLAAEMYWLEFADQREYDHYLALTRNSLDPDTFDALYAEGRAMSLEDAIAYALETPEPEPAVVLVEPLKTDLEIAPPKTPQPLADPLSQRELDVLVLITEGLTNQEIADRLYIGISTVKKHINHIYSKLDVTHRAQAVARARALDILS